MPVLRLLGGDMGVAVGMVGVAVGATVGVEVGTIVGAGVTDGPVTLLPVQPLKVTMTIINTIRIPKIAR